MMASEIDSKIAAGLESGGPRIHGRVVSESAASLVIKSADAVIEIPARHIVSRQVRGTESDVELLLAPDANLLVSAVVSVERGFVGSNIFGPLVPDIIADNCNCNCNCGSIQATASVEEFSRLRHPLTDGGARTETLSQRTAD